MSHEMRTLPFEVLLDWILTEYEQNGSIFGIPKGQFYLPTEDPPYATDRLFGSHLTTPIGPAAGPHTQLSQNIVSAWLCGGRFIELKTVQVMDELEIPRPCIDLADEGYNVEWSQELKLSESASEYAKAWALVHILRRLLGLEKKTRFGTIFNMSVGYDLEGILSPTMQTFMDRLEDASAELDKIRELLRRRFPRFAGIEIPNRIVNSVTLSTMHGCPPDEIEQIANYLLEKRGLHTTVKLNPTLLGKDAVLEILHDNLGFREIEIPDSVFENDLGYQRAVELISSLKGVADERALAFSVKLSNTLAMANRRGVLPGDEMYMSGRPLFPLTVRLFRRLVETFDGDLNVSYSAGADALNLPDLLATGALPVTVASDLLKPGGYGRFGQYLDRLATAMEERGASNLDELSANRSDRLKALSEIALREERYKKGYFPYGLPKVSSPLKAFDCVEAPCVEQCAVHQDIPEYAWWIARGDEDRALEAILARNPLPGVTGYICTHLCQTRCTRNNYDEPVAIRKLKRFASEHGTVRLTPAARTDRSVAVIGSGPSGLAAAAFLALNGVEVTIFEARDRPGGMLAIAPEFRLPSRVVRQDIARIRDLGVAIETGHRIEDDPERLLDAGFDAVYIACGFSRDAGLPIGGIDADGVLGAIEFLDRVAHADPPRLGSRVVVIGGGNTAMDAARTAQRLTGAPVTILYRRSRAEMPAEAEEIRDLLAEGNRLEELVSPIRVVVRDGRAVGLECQRNRLGEPDEGGRRRPVTIEGSNFAIDADAILLATGQRPDTCFLEGSNVSVHAGGGIVVEECSGRASERPIFAGGDVVRGPETIIAACADGRRAAEAICERLGLPFSTSPWERPALSQDDVLLVKVLRARKSAQTPTKALPVSRRGGFDLIEETFSPEAARIEAERCLQCATVCDKCVEVCPNRANLPLTVTPLEVRIPSLTCVAGRLEIGASEPVCIAQTRQIIHVDDACNECGNCATFCVHPGDPFRQKPRLYLNRSGFAAEDDNAFYLNAGTLARREAGVECRLTPVADGYRYETDEFSLHLSHDLEIEETDLRSPFAGTRSLRPAVEMAALLEGLRNGARFLLQASEGLARLEGSP